MKYSNTMNKIFTILIFALAINASAQQTPKTSTNQYSNGKKTGLWTQKQLSSTWDGIPVVKADLRWSKVTESRPFKEITEITTENYLKDRLEGLWTQTKTVKNSWGDPAPGGTSSSVYIVKKNFVGDEMTTIEATRKKNGKINLSLKGAYKNKLVDGVWLFNDNNKTYSYTFTNGYLTNYEIKEIGTGKLIEGNKIEVDNDLINNYFTKSDNNFEIEYGQNFSELRDAKISIQKVNENLSIIKLCRLIKEAANFVNLDVRLFSNAFGEITPYKNENYNEFGYSPSITCEVLSENNYRILDDVYFKDVKSEYAFLNLTTNSQGQFLNTDWENIKSFTNSRYFFQLKSYLYKGDTTRLKAFLTGSKKFNIIEYFSTEPIPNGKYVNVGNNEVEFNDYLQFLVSLSLGDKENWKAFIDKTYNSNAFSGSWQEIILNQFTEIQASTSFVKTDINDAINYLKSKDDEIKQMNNVAISNIKEFKLGNQVWMATDLCIIPSHLSYQLVIDNKIQDNKVGKGLILYGLSNDNKNLCPNGWRLPRTSDWETLIKSLGGDKKAAGELLMVGKGSGFETAFPIIFQTDDYNKKLKFSTSSPGGYITLDANGNVTAFKFGYDYQFTYYTNTSFVPCRCIKE